MRKLAQKKKNYRMYNETLFEVDKVIQIKWVKSKHISIQTDSSATSSGKVMMRNITLGNLEIISPSAIAMSIQKKKMMIQNTRKKLHSTPTLIITITHATRTELNISTLPSPKKRNKRKITHISINQIKTMPKAKPLTLQSKKNGSAILTVRNCR